jgi:hypothetical protein
MTREEFDSIIHDYYDEISTKCGVVVYKSNGFTSVSGGVDFQIWYENVSRWVGVDSPELREAVDSVMPATQFISWG